MTHDDAIELLNMHLIDYNDGDSLEILLDLSDDEVKFILNNYKEKGQKWFSNYVEIITNKDLYASPYYDYVKDTLKNIDSIVDLKVLKDLILDFKLLNSNYYKKIFELSLSMNEYRISDFVLLVTDSYLFNKNYYMDVIDGFVSIKNRGNFTSDFVKLFTNKKFIESDIYLEVLEQYLSNPRFKSDIFCSRFTDIILKPSVNMSPYFMDIYNFIIKQSDVVIELTYELLCVSGILDKEYCMEVLKITSSYNNYNPDYLYSLDMFYSFIRNYNFMKYDSCLKILTKVCDIKDYHALKLIKYLYDNGYDKNSKYDNNIYYIYKICIKKSEYLDSEVLHQVLDIFISPKYTKTQFEQIYDALIDITDNNMICDLYNLITDEHIIRYNLIFLSIRFIKYISYLDMDIRNEKYQTLFNLLKKSNRFSIKEARNYMYDVVNEIYMDLDTICANNKANKNADVLKVILDTLENNRDDNVTSDIIKFRKK